MVGICWATADYKKMSGIDEFYSVDIFEERDGIVPDIVADITTDEFVKKCDKKFNMVLLHGVIGFGLDSIANIKLAIENLHKVMNDGGKIIIVWPKETILPKKILQMLSGKFKSVPVKGKIPYFWKDSRKIFTLEAIKI
jgi:hypothetical protein